MGLLPFVAGFVLALATAHGVPPPSTSPGSPAAESAARQQPAARKVLQLHLRGDLDSMKLARDFADRLAAAIDDGTEVLLLELSGDRWRADAVHAIAKSMRPSSGASSGRRSGIRVLAWLHDDADRRIGFGQAALALLADECAISPRTRLVFESATDLRYSAPPDTDWETVDRELSGLLYLAAKDRAADTMLAAALPRPAGPLWAVPRTAGTPWAITSNPGDDSRKLLIIPASEGDRPPRIEWDAAMMRRLGIATTEAGDAGQLLAAAGLRARPMVRAEISSGLGEARGKIEQLIRRLDECLVLVGNDLSNAAKLRGQDATRRKREAGEAALKLINEAERRLLEAETVMTDYPDLLAGLPPGRTPVGQDPTKHAVLWRFLFQDRRDDIAALRARAEGLARTP